MYMALPIPSTVAKAMFVKGILLRYMSSRSSNSQRWENTSWPLNRSTSVVKPDVPSAVRQVPYPVEHGAFNVRHCFESLNLWSFTVTSLDWEHVTRFPLLRASYLHYIMAQFACLFLCRHTHTNRTSPILFWKLESTDADNVELHRFLFVHANEPCTQVHGF